MEPTSNQALIFNGVNPVTGTYLIDPHPVRDLIRSAQVLRKGELWFGDEHLKDLSFRDAKGVEPGLDPSRLDETGWGLVFPADAEPALVDAILEALQELVSLRQSQAGERFRIFRGEEGVRLQENADRFLARHGSSPGRVDPDRLPYYLLLVSDPQSIPFSFQYALDVNYAVGRIYFDRLEEFSHYARSVVLCETGQVSPPHRAAFWGTAHPGDQHTDLSARQFLQPLFAEFQEHSQDQGWQAELYEPDRATKASLLGLLGGPETPALLVTACHGVGYPYGHPEQARLQGSLVCQDWGGPGSSLARDAFVSAEDIPAQANLLGSIIFHYASFATGTPYLEDWLLARDRARPALAHRALLSTLPQRLLGHPGGGALAVIGQAERAWGYSIPDQESPNPSPAYRQFLEALLRGASVQSAMEAFKDRYAVAAQLLSNELDELRYRQSFDSLRVARLLIENNEARSLTLLGDPAARLPLAPHGKSVTRPALEPVALSEKRLPVVMNFEAIEEPERRAVEAEIANLNPEASLEPVEAPEELVNAILRGECVLWTGWGLPAAAGLPTWANFVEDLEKWMLEHRLLDPNLASSIRQAILMREHTNACEAMVSALRRSDPRARQLQKYIYAKYQKQASLPDSQIYTSLARLGFRACVSTTYDTLLEQAFQEQGDPLQVYTLEDTEALRPALVERKPFLLKLYGTPHEPPTILVVSSQLAEALLDSPVFESLIQNLFASRTVFFVGLSPAQIQKDLEALRLRLPSRRHFALVEFERATDEADAGTLQARFQVEALPIQGGRYAEKVNAFLSGLQAQVEQYSAEAAFEPDQPQTPRLKWLRLENIGPFDSLELELDPNFNILLGDNGVGKTSLLKALALVLARQEARGFADRLIRFRSQDGREIEKGQVTLRTADGEEHVVELLRQPGKPAEVRVTSRWALETMKWVALGFPPLRHLDQQQLEGPKPIEGTPTFTPADLVPLLRGGLDGRMQDLSQWIINLDYLSISNPRYAQLKDDFFQVLKEITEGVNLGFSRIVSNGKNFQIMLSTDDGEVPIDLISQGTQSLLGWIGYLLERLYEVYPDADSPREQPALVLIDEIDAHMHPLWQQNIYLHLRKLFPLVQFIATTHSPLVVANAEQCQVKIFERDAETRQVRLRELNRSPQGMGVAGLLTSGFFGLGSQLDQTAQEKLLQKRRLASKDPADLTDDDKTELRRLDEEIKAMGLVHEYRDPLYSEFLNAWYDQAQKQPELNEPVLTEEQRKRQAEIVRQLVEQMKADPEKRDAA